MKTPHQFKMPIYWVISKDKRTGTKLSWLKIQNILLMMYPTATFNLKVNESGTSLTMSHEEQYLHIKLNKDRYCGIKEGKWYETIPINSFIFNNPSSQVVKAFKLQPINTSL
ncbi:Hypothetical protein HVR_LOCUS122 [uncultured virus]|nr:Hypothetical protein HVR_LOCUS122 [uncultured virus]